MLLSIAIAALVSQTPPPPGVAGGGEQAPALQEAVLQRAIFVVQRDACVLVEPDAPSVVAYGFNRMGDVALVKGEVARCGPLASVPSLVRALAVTLSLATKKEAPPSTLPAFDAKALDEACFAITGKRLLLSTTTSADPAAPIHAYDPVALRALFDALYAAPTEKRLGMPMKALYDATVKPVVARVAADVALLTARPEVLAAEAKRLVEGAKSGKGAAGKDAWRMALNKLVKSDEDAARIDPRLVGFVLRRHADGTLPVIVELLDKVTKAYDQSGR